MLAPGIGAVVDVVSEADSVVLVGLSSMVASVDCDSSPAPVSVGVDSPSPSPVDSVAIEATVDDELSASFRSSPHAAAMNRNARTNRNVRTKVGRLAGRRMPSA